MKILLNKGRNKSLSSYLNYYAIEGNIHIMDNHLGAIAPLYEFGNKLKEMIFYHIDRHYDLGGLNDYHEEYFLGQKQIPEIKQLDSVKSIRGCNIFLWDNYIHLFYSRFDEKVKETYFITHQTTQFFWDWDNFQELTPFQLINHHPYDEKGIIFNLDIDFFFHQTKEGDICEAFSEKYLEEFQNWFTNNKDRFELIIIALSPECCGRWPKAIGMFNKLFPELEIAL